MADWQQYHDSEPPIPVPPVNLAWEDMRQRLDKERRRPAAAWPRFFLTVALLLSWLAPEPVRHRLSSPGLHAGQDIGTGIAATTQQDQHDTNHPLQPIDRQDIQDHSPGRPVPILTAASARQRRSGKAGNRDGSQHVSVDTDPADEPAGGNTVVVTDDTPVKASQTQEAHDVAVTDTTNRKTSKQEPQDSSGAGHPDEQAGQKDSQRWQYRFGVQWELQVPTTGTYGYFHGLDNTPEPWRSLVPGIWLEAVQGKNALNFSFMPMIQQLVSDDVFRVQSSISQGNDTTASREDTKHLYKLLGMSASIGYARNLRGNWWGGLSFQAAWWRQALAASDVRVNYIVSGQSVAQETFTERYAIPEEEWEYFNRMQTFFQADLTYRKQRWQSGLRAGVALTPLGRQEGPGHIFRAAAFFRLSFGK